MAYFLFAFYYIIKRLTLISRGSVEFEFQVVWSYVSSSGAIFLSLSRTCFPCLELDQAATKWLSQTLANYFQV